MLLRDPRDFHFIALCLSYGIATPQVLAGVIQRLEKEPELSLGDLLVREGILTARQVEAVIGEIFANRTLARVLSVDGGAAEPDLGGAPNHAETRTLSASSMEDAPTLLLREHFETLDDPLPEFQSATGPGGQSAAYPGPPGSWPSAATASLGSSFSAAVRDRRAGEQLIGTEIAGHVIEGVFGKGAQGQVFKARQTSLGRIVALKILPPELTSDEPFVRRFIQESRTLAAFTHPNIIQVYDAGNVDGVFYFTMEAVPGQSLRDLLTSQSKIPVAVGVNMLKQCLQGLERASRAGVIHRDIKPANLMIDNQGIIKLADFGIAERIVSGGALTSREIAGTPHYISPEQARGRDVTSAADQYSLGATFFHLLTGAPPFQGDSAKSIIRKHMDEPPPDPCVLAPEIHPELGAMLLRMMAKEPDQRYATLQELFAQLERFELREGLIESRTTFLADNLINIGERSIQGLKRKILMGVTIGVSTTLAAIALAEALERTGLAAWKAPIGNVGAAMLLAGFAAIMYIAAVRKRWVPALGNVRVWLQAHIVLALTGYLLSMVHSGNFLRFFMPASVVEIPGHGMSARGVPVIPFLNSLLFTGVVTSGLVGRYIWRDIANQIATEKIRRGDADAGQESHELTLSIFAQKALRYWRIFHYPMAFALVVVTALHVISILYFGGKPAGR